MKESYTAENNTSGGGATAMDDLEQARSDLADSESRFKEIAELLPGIICEMDLSLKLTYANKMAFTIFGFTKDEFAQGVNANDYIFPEDRERIAKDIHNILHGDYGNPAVYRLRTKTGAVRQVLINSAPIVKNESVTGIRTCIVDITDRIAAEEKLRESEEKFKTIFRQSPIGIALFDRGGGLIESNGSYDALFGPGAAKDADAPCSSLFAMLDVREDERRELGKGGMVRRETAAAGENGALRWFDWHVIPLGRGMQGPSVFLAQVEESTEKRLKQEMQLLKQREAIEKAEALVAGLRHELLDKSCFQSMVSRSPAMREIFGILPEIAGAMAPVLVCGESGTGKELLARSLHALSPRCDQPFVAVNCAALPDTLLESELFGYRAGAFTDAKKDKPGKIALADKGTIFFDEIGDISAAMQAKLLRVLQEKVFEPLGGTASVRADVRVLAATNRDLHALIKKGVFREDLYYRINVVTVRLPPLRERRCDIPLLCDRFIERFNARYGKSIAGISQDAMEVILSHEFPGNIRELENAIEHAFIFCKDSMIDIAHLPALLRGAPAGADLEMLSSVRDFDELERLYLGAVLKETNGNKPLAAARLGIHKATLFRKLRRFGL
ncbi:MAG: sigma 54-interacting transcriptional regulator [Chitinispirillaceae bacterium]|nr:sigma 54-interacting transcriptional regulator [Chitinispirillaceae bacterium]